MHKIVLWHRYLCEITSFDQNMTYDVKKIAGNNTSCEKGEGYTESVGLVDAQCKHRIGQG